MLSMHATYNSIHVYSGLNKIFTTTGCTELQIKSYMLYLYALRFNSYYHHNMLSKSTATICMHISLLQGKLPVCQGVNASTRRSTVVCAAAEIWVQKC